MTITTLKRSSVIDVCSDPVQIEAAKRGDLFAKDGLPVLIIKGENCAKAATEQIYKAFSQHKDEHNNPFVFSRSQKAICESGPFGSKIPVNYTRTVGYLRLGNSSPGRRDRPLVSRQGDRYFTETY